MIIVDLLLIAVLVYAAFVGAKRGMMLIALELGSFVLATVGAMLLYHPFSGLITKLAHTSNALGNVFAFASIGMTIEVVTAVLVRFKVLPHLPKHLELSRLNQIGGGILNTLKGLFIITLALIVFAGLPLSSS